MSAIAKQYQPDYAVPPGWVLAERLEAQGISQAEFARRCGRSPKLISQIIGGEASVEPGTALQFERVLGVDASVWLGIEADYRLRRARAAERQKMAESVEWAERFPIRELVKRGDLPQAASQEDGAPRLLAFFGVGSVKAWETRQRRIAYAYRHSASFKSDEAALATWLRLGEIEAESLECSIYSEAEFKQALAQIRNLTAEPFVGTLEMAQRLCAQAGVALTIIKPLPRTALSGASRWLSPSKAAIHLTARHLTDDQLWFSLFHEAAHLLLHSKKSTYVHETKGGTTEDEAAADKWAAEFLVREQDWRQFVDSDSLDPSGVTGFAQKQGIAPGIVVGRLQHEKRLEWNRLNELKARLEWRDDAGSAPAI